MDDQPSLISQFMHFFPTVGLLINNDWASPMFIGLLCFFQYMVLQESNRFQVTHIVVPLPALKLDFVVGVCPSLVKPWHC